VMHDFQPDASHLERLPAYGCEPRVGGRVGVDEAARRNLHGPFQGPCRGAIFQQACCDASSITTIIGIAADSDPRSSVARVARCHSPALTPFDTVCGDDQTARSRPAP
jgi:hypothetical protein